MSRGKVRAGTVSSPTGTSRDKFASLLMQKSRRIQFGHIYFSRHPKTVCWALPRNEDWRLITQTALELVVTLEKDFGIKISSSEESRQALASVAYPAEDSRSHADPVRLAG